MATVAATRTERGRQTKCLLYCTGGVLYDKGRGQSGRTAKAVEARDSMRIRFARALVSVGAGPLARLQQNKQGQGRSQNIMQPPTPTTYTTKGTSKYEYCTMLYRAHQTDMCSTTVLTACALIMAAVQYSHCETTLFTGGCPRPNQLRRPDGSTSRGRRFPPLEWPLLHAGLVGWLSDTLLKRTCREMVRLPARAPRGSLAVAAVAAAQPPRGRTRVQALLLDALLALRACAVLAFAFAFEYVCLLGCCGYVKLIQAPCLSSPPLVCVSRPINLSCVSNQPPVFPFYIFFSLLIFIYLLLYLPLSLS